MKIKDRLRLRLTCRGFEKLVAESHAGYFREGMISTAYPTDPIHSTLRWVIGDQKLHDSKEAGLEQFFHLRNRLFSGVIFGCWEFRLTGTTFTHEYLSDFADNFQADKIICQVDTREQLSIALKLVWEFPGSTYMLDLGFLPDTEQLRSLPTLDELQITTPARNRIGFGERYEEASQISGDLFFELLDTHKKVYLDNVVLSSEEWERMLQIISDDSAERWVQLGVKRTTIAKWMSDYGITHHINAGDRIGEFEVLSKMESRQMIELRYKRCTIWIERFIWTEGELPVFVDMQNSENPC